MRIVEYWFRRCLCGFTDTTWHDQLRIYGTHEFRDRTAKALGLLEGAGQSAFIGTHLTELCQGLRSTGYILPRGTPSYVVGEFTWKLSPGGYASMIAHHAFRKKAYESNGGSADPRTEVDCFCFQETILEKLQVTNEDWDDATGLAMSEVRELYADNASKERQKRYADDRKRRYGLRSILPDAWFYSVVEHRGIWIRGSEEFIAHSCNALELLAKISEWNIIGDNIRSIRQSSKSSTHVRTVAKEKDL